MVYVISLRIIQVSDPDGVCHLSICYTDFRSRWCMSFHYVLYRFQVQIVLSFQYLLYSFQDQMVYVISLYVIHVSGPYGLCVLFYLQCEADDNE